MPTNSPSATLRAQLRAKIINRIADLKLRDSEAADQMRFTPQQMSRLRSGVDEFSLDRLVDAAVEIGIRVRMTAVRPYRSN